MSQGGDLRQAFARDELDEYAWHDRGRQIALDIARGLHFLHMSGVIHRCWLLHTAYLRSRCVQP